LRVEPLEQLVRVVAVAALGRHAPRRRVRVCEQAERLELGELRPEELDAYRRLFELVEKRAALLDVLASTRDPRRPFVRVGHELELPALHEIALVGACYGLVHRALGAVSIVGPVRMDYEKALGAVRSAASELSRFVESIYDER